jgi:hypothetical protein
MLGWGVRIEAQQPSCWTAVLAAQGLLNQLADRGHVQRSVKTAAKLLLRRATSWLPRCVVITSNAQQLVSTRPLSGRKMFRVINKGLTIGLN